MKIWCIYTFLKNPKRANYFNDDTSSVSLKRGFGALENGWCCDYPMEGQIFAYMQLRMVIMSHVKTGFTQPSGIITKAREGMFTSSYWLRIIHRWEQSSVSLRVFWGLLCVTRIGCQTCHRCFSNEQVPKTEASYRLCWVLHCTILIKHVDIRTGFKILKQLLWVLKHES